MRFKEQPLGDVAALYDSLHQTPSYSDEGFPMVRVTDISMGYLDVSSCRKVDSETYLNFIRNYRPDVGDILFSRVGSYGNSCYVKTYEDFCLGQNTVCISANTESIEPYFLYCSLNSNLLKNQIVSLATGASQPTISLGSIRKLIVPTPPLPTQKKIASVLSAYDDLIENNERRIKILEEMAQSIYREWFVNYRFPGHENVQMVDSELGEIPEGWGVRQFAGVAKFINGFAFKPVHWQETGKPIVKIKELKNGITADTPRYHGDDIDSKYHIIDGNLLFSWSGDLDAYIWDGGDALLNQHLFHVIPESVLSKQFLFHSLRNNMERFRSLTTGSTLHHIKRSALSEVSTVWPAESVTAEFGQISTQISAQRLGYQRTIENLRQTRDLLLPKLISGELDVEELDIAVA